MDEELGFEPENVLTARITLPEARYPEWPQRHLFWGDLMARIRGLPGVEAAGLTSALPLSRPADGGSFQIEGREWDDGEGPSIDKKTASPGYFTAMGIPVLEGRAFSSQDRSDSPLVTVVSESVARRFFPNESPLGRKIRIGWWGNEFVEIVGVVGDVKQVGADQGAEVAAYLPQAQTGAPDATLVIKVRGEPYSLTGSVRSVVLELDRGQPIYNVTNMDDLMIGSLARRTALTTLLLGLSVIALVISCLGVYAVTAQAVRGRSQEIGIRMALGASGKNVLRSVVLTESWVIAVGILFGLGAAAAMTRALETVLFGVTALDPLTLIVSVATLGGVALLAVLGPALRAARIDPAESLAANR
jgi:putative ABC transport system permease protein